MNTKPIQPKSKLHNWHIEAREIDRHTTRRGRKHAYEHLNPKQTALVVVDMIPFFVNENPYCLGIVPNISSLADTLRSRGGTIVWVVPATRKPSTTRVEFYGREAAENFANSGGKGAIQDRLWHKFKVNSNDVLIEKINKSAFFPGSSNIVTELSDRKIDTVLITGTVANVCCESTARDAAELDYRVVMVADANAARRDQDLNSTLYTIYRSFGDVRSTKDILEML